MTPDDTPSCCELACYEDPGCSCEGCAPSPDALREAAQRVADAWDAEGYIGNDYLVAGVAASMRDLRAALALPPRDALDVPAPPKDRQTTATLGDYEEDRAVTPRTCAHASNDVVRLYRQEPDGGWTTETVGFACSVCGEQFFPGCTTAAGVRVAPPPEALLDVERLARALHATGLNTIGKKPGSHGRFTDACICNADAAAIAREYAALDRETPA